MAEESSEEKLARLEAENKALKDQIEQRKPGQLRLKISEKGGLSVYGLGRFPVTLYKEQWKRLLEHAEENTRQAFAAMRAAAAAKNPAEVARIQGDYLKQQGARALTHAREIGELILQFGRDAMGEGKR